MLVVVLGLLVALFVIGTSFSFVTLSERRAASNYLDRQRALDLALDGVEYSIARLRAESTQLHYEGIGPGTAGVDDSGLGYEPHDYANKPLDAADPSVSWARGKSATSAQGAIDGNWVDFDGDNRRGGNETGFGSDKTGGGFLNTVTGFHADGINVNQVKNRHVARADGDYGPSGTYEELGDYFRVRAIDAASMLNITNFPDRDHLTDVLLVLGEAIDAWLNNDETKGDDNPFPPAVVQDFVETAADVGYIFGSKEELRPIWKQASVPGWEEGERDRMYELAMKFITVNSWVDNKYRDFAESNMKGAGEAEPLVNPLGLEDVRLFREGFSDPNNLSQNGADGWPDWKPNASSYGKAPVNVNTAPKPVLVAMLANVKAYGRLLFYKRHSDITESDKLIYDSFGDDVPAQRSGTTDLGRQNNRNDISGTGIQGEDKWHPTGSNNRAIFQLVPIGPIETTLGKRGATSSVQGSGEDYASALADEIIRLRADHPFTSWQDFDTRFCRAILLSIDDSTRDNVTIPDLVGIGRSDLSRPPGDLDRIFPRKLLPDPANVDHPANALGSGDASMSPSDFRAWYWKSCVDMIRASLCPSNLTARYNEDYPYHMNVDRMDLVRTNAPICFSSMGVFEIESQGEILAPGDIDETATASSPDQRLPIARRKVRSVVQIYEVMRHSSQADFTKPLDPSQVIRGLAGGNQQPDDRPETMVAHTKKNTVSGPFSIDEISNGSWEDNNGDETRLLNERDDAKGIGYKEQEPGEPPTARDRMKGHNKYTAADGDFGYVKMNPRDESPFEETNFRQSIPLTFHARFNESLWGRTKSTAFSQVQVEGVNSDQLGLDQQWGHLPWTKEAMFDDFISSATPRSTEKPLLVGGGGASNEFQNADAGAEATKYSSLRPDGLYLWGGHLRPRSTNSLYGTYGLRGLGRIPRLKILRYPCGAQGPSNPFQPIRENSWIGDADLDDGVRDADQVGNVPAGTIDEAQARLRLGVSPNSTSPHRGTDQHNRSVENVRQMRSNMPYYEGTVDFWIKWDLPPQGSQSQVADQVVAMGEVDPASHNFSGLFGATAFGRFTNSSQYSDPAAANRDRDADFEGVQFFVYKEPGGWLRFTRLYFAEAFGAAVPGGATSSVPQSPVRFGSAMRRVVDANSADPNSNPFSHYTGTSDIVNDRGFGDSNKGFLYSRTDAWLDLSTANFATSPGGLDNRIVLRPHDWHRFTLSYNSNTSQPYRLWLDGRRVSGVAFRDDPDGTLGFRNDGRHAPMTDQPVPLEDASEPTLNIYRSVTKLMEINPEDRLTVGCIFRRQVDLTLASVYSDYYTNEDDQGDLVKPPRPVFKFDANFVAVANATIDDFRVTYEVIDDGREVNESEFAPHSRYNPANSGEDCYFEHGFLPISGQDGELHALPVRLGTISWTELRPDWDPYRNRGLSAHNSSGLQVEWAVFDDFATVGTGGTKHDFASASSRGGMPKLSEEAIDSDEYWARGGMSLEGSTLPSGAQVGVFIYRVHFQTAEDITVNNVTPYLLDVTVTMLTPPRKLSFIIEY